MSDTRDPIGISSVGIQSIMPTMGSSRRPSKGEPEDDRDTDHAQTEAQTEPHDPSPAPLPPGTGRLIDKTV
jgi:hypothetical protein